MLPQEIKDLVIVKYRQEITSSCNFLSPKLSTKESSEDTVATSGDQRLGIYLVDMGYLFHMGYGIVDS